MVTRSTSIYKVKHCSLAVPCTNLKLEFSMDILCFMSIIACILVPSLKTSSAVDSIAEPNYLSDDGNTLISKDGTFKLGFFSPGSSQKRYLGIWYQNIPVQTVVWVANRLNPINDSSGVLEVKNNGSLVLTQNGTVVWHTTSVKQAQNPVAQLLDSGNLVVRDENRTNPEAYLWQSFDYPSDTLLPGMKLGCDLVTGLNRFLTSWKSWDDPSPGDFSWVMEVRDFPESYFMKGNKKYYRSGPWNGLLTSGSPDLTSNNIFDPYFEFNEREVYYSYNMKNSEISRLVMNQSDHSVRHRYLWSKTEQNWEVYSTAPRDSCDTYAQCGANANCIISHSPMCQCLKGFKPKSPHSWNLNDWSEGCVRNVTLSCKDKGKDGFEKLVGLKLPETTNAWLDQTMGLEQCREKCLNNCSCKAYANSDISGEDYGCAMWFGDLIDIREFSADGQNLYIRIAASELDAEQHGRRKKLTTIVASTIAAVSGMLLLGCYFIYRVRRKRTENFRNIEGGENSGESEDDLDLPLFDLSTLVVATDNFSEKNKIGEGGFGPVYKGILVNGKEIAVKKLSRSSGQGMTEFKNEVKLIAKLQHRNLVRLLGCCIQGQESQDKMLVYEYMPNKSLDYFIFDNNEGKVLNWIRRFHIICGIARGLLYLHQDSRLRIIHRDLKASNILLDEELNPKISDFGMARTFRGDQTEGNTKTVVGTYGYMSPEYAADGLFSVKSDVFSFGVLLLEIISGRKNRGFYQANHTKNLVSHAWILWREGRALELVDKNIEQYIASEVLRCIRISLLCVQLHPGDRPTMSSVVLMLGSEIELAEPNQPGFFPGNDYVEASSSSSQQHSNSTNKMTVTLIEGR